MESRKWNLLPTTKEPEPENIPFITPLKPSETNNGYI